MKPPKHSKAAIKAHPAPVHKDDSDGTTPDFKKLMGKDYALACMDTEAARVVFDKQDITPSARLDGIGIEFICKCIAAGQSLRAWAAANGFVQQTVINWIDADKERAGHYAHAREEREDLVFDSLDEIGDQAVVAESATEVAGLRLKSDNIKWKLARMNAKKFGDKLAVGGAEGMPAIQFERIERVIIDPK